MLPQQGRRGVPGGQVPVADHGHVGGVEHPLQPEFLIEPLGQPQDLPVAFGGGANDHLGGLPGRDELGRVAVGCQGVAVFLDAVPDEPHGGQDFLLALLGRQQLQALLRGQLDVDAHAVGVQAQLVGQLGRGPGDGLYMDVPAKPLHLAQALEHRQHPLAGVVRVF